MASGRIAVPGQFPSFEGSLQDIKTGLVADRVGMTLHGIESQRELFDIFAAQSEQLIKAHNNSAGISHFTPAEMEWALRQIRRPAVNEEPFWQELAPGCASEGAGLRVIVPYKPQAELMERFESDHDILLHMSLGLWRAIHPPEGDSVTVYTHTNLWTVPDRRSDRPQAVRAAKDTIGFKILGADETIDTVFDSPSHRSRELRTGQHLVHLLQRD